jgi:hypothetical protein
VLGGALVETASPFGFSSSTVVLDRMRSPLTAVPQGSHVPVSRGAACRRDGAPLPSCPLTDGALEPVLLGRTQQSPSGPILVEPDPQAPDAELFQVELPYEVVLRTLVLRSFSVQPHAPVQVEGSADGQTWHPLAEVPPEELQSSEPFFSYRALRGEARFLLLELDPATPPVRFVRLVSQQASLVSLSELSLFE